MKTLHFRDATSADAPALAAFMERNFRSSYGHGSTPENIDAAVRGHYGLAAQLRQLADPSRWHLLAEGEAGELLGHAQVQFEGAVPDAVQPRPAAEVTRFYVDAVAHGRGVAQRMLAEVEAHARRRGIASLWLSVWTEQPQAVRFYEKSGFAPVGKLVFHIGDDAKDDWLMLKALGDALA
jgi:ribosomal protein S18 acetylase RimI-like enzyme